jgi:hypothetical protein
MSRLKSAGVGLLSVALLAGSAFAEGSKDAAKAPAPSKEAAKAPPAKDPEAMASLKAMGDALGQAKTLKFKTRGLRPMQLQDGQWITLVMTANVARQGNDKLRIESGGDAFPFDFIYDGKTVTAFAPKEKIYAQNPAAPTIDDALAQSEKRGEVTIAFGDLVKSDPYSAMTARIKKARVIGTSTVGGVETQHLAVEGDKNNWEVWIGTQDHLPRMVTLTDLTDTRKPTHTMEFSDWKLDENLTPDLFSFNAPADATKVPFRKPGAEKMVAGRPGPHPSRK